MQHAKTSASPTWDFNSRTTRSRRPNVASQPESRRTSKSSPLRTHWRVPAPTRSTLSTVSTSPESIWPRLWATCKTHMTNNGANEEKTAPGSGSVADPPNPSPATPTTDTTPSFLATAGEAIRELSRLAKFALIVLLLVVLAGWYIWIGRVSTNDAQVDA